MLGASEQMSMEKWYAIRFLSGEVLPYERIEPEKEEPLLCSRLGFLLLRRGFVLFQLIRGGVFRLREAHYLVFFRYVIFPPIVPL